MGLVKAENLDLEMRMKEMAIREVTEKCWSRDKANEVTCIYTHINQEVLY